MKFFFAGTKYDYEVSYENGYFVIIAQDVQQNIQAQITHLDFIVRFLEVDTQELLYQQAAWALPLKPADKLLHKTMRLVYQPDLVELLEKDLSTQQTNLEWETII
ncbi:MAG: hypothetical protein MUE85_03885 [Microscillaceae bacterium]|jgi:hypothetical protein|nr:hypothetical protein [Microscillaceae bacterium]